jgi:hypothetical protein
MTNKKGGRGKEKGCSKVIFSILFFTKTPFFFPLFVP